MRALETGRYMLRATNTGVTAIIDQRGKVLQELEMFTTAGLHGIAQGYSGTTPYVRVGNGLVLGVAGLLLIIGWLSVFFYGKRKTL
jgi:apolipoprotein N-acyltransferase